MDLGDFGFSTGIRIYNIASASLESSFVEVHESYHLYMTLSTPFGIFQNILGFIVSSDDIQLSIKPFYHEALKATKEKSWNTHEGVATTCELLFCLFHSKETASHTFDILPLEYKKACVPLCKIISQIPLPLIVSYPIVEAIGYISLATPILRDMGEHSVFAKTDWEHYFKDIDRNPDLRFAILLDTLSSQQARNKIYNSVIDAFNTLGLPSEEIKFIDCYRNLTIEKQKHCNDMVREAVINSLRSNISLTVEDEANITPLFRFLKQSWISALGINHIQNSIVENPNPSDKEAQLRIFLDKTDYVPPPNQEMHPEGILFIHNPNFVFVDNLNNYGNPLYAKLLFNGSSEDIGTLDNPLMMPIGGGVLLLHAVKHIAEKFHFICPIEHDNPKHANATYAKKYLPERIINFCNDLSKVDCIICLDEMAYRWLPNHMKLFLKQYNGPMMIIPTSSRLSWWCETIRDLLGCEHVLGCYGVNNVARDFCIMSSQDGHVVLARPTSQIVYSRILKNNNFIQSCSDWNDISKQFSPEWSLKLRIACNHYLQFGW
jgi:hypothetical protein